MRVENRARLPEKGKSHEALAEDGEGYQSSNSTTQHSTDSRCLSTPGPERLAQSIMRLCGTSS